MRLPLVTLVPLVLVACVKAAPPPNPAPVVVDAGPDEADLAGLKLDAVEREVAQVIKLHDEALWKHWTLGAPLDLAAAWKGHDSLLAEDTPPMLQHLRALRPGDVERIDALSRFLVGEVLVRSASAEADAIANLEASATFLADGKETPFRDVGKLVLNEKSALKRRQVWTASHDVAARLGALIEARDVKLEAKLKALGLPSLLVWSAQSRGFELDALEKNANEVLTSTQDEWMTTLKALSDLDVRLPIAQLTRGDLPRLLKVPATLDAEFPKQKIATRIVQTLGTLGVYGQPGLTLELAEAAKKNPLPLTVAPSPGDVRVSFRPLGGLKDQQLALSEVGAALALHEARSLHLGRLALPLVAELKAETLAALLTDAKWLTANEVKEVDAVVAAARAQRLFSLRRAAGLVLARIEASRAGDDAGARAAFVTILTRALGIALASDEGVRWRLETDDFLRSATQLEARRRTERPPSP